MLFTAKLFAQVSGYAYLEDQTNHAGIKVVFTAQSPTAKTDSCYTDSTGFYSKTLSNGVYWAKFTKQNFDTIDYLNKKNILINSTSQTLTTQNLNSTKFRLKGNISGILKKNITYLVDDDITVPEGEELIIEEGVKLIGNKNLLNCIGNLTINGQENNIVKIDSLQINFSLSIIKISNSKFTNSNITSFKASFFDLPYNLIDIRYSEFDNTQLDLNGNQINISTCFFHDFNEQNIFFDNYHSRTVFAYECKGIFSCNKIINCLDAGIHFTNNSDTTKELIIIENNIIENINKFNSIYRDSKPFAIGGYNCIIRGNIVKNTNIGIFCSNCDITNNNVISCDTALTIGDSFKIINNNLSNNLKAIFIQSKIDNDTLSKKSIINNLFYNNKLNNVFFMNASTYAGSYFMTNQNGDSVDVYNNILSNPQLLDSYGLTYSSTSPLIQNGTNIGVQYKYPCYNPVYIPSTLPLSPDTLKISGTVHYGKLDNKEKNAQVIAYNLDNQNIYSTYTDSLGQFEFDSLSIGKYILKTISSTPNHTETFYPATTDSVQSSILDLQGNISGIDIIIDIETGISNDTEDNEIKVYPNPFDNLLHIRNFNKNINYNKISIENSLGDVKLEFNQADETSEIILDLNILPAGVYFLNLETIDSKIIRKIIKN